MIPILQKNSLLTQTELNEEFIILINKEENWTSFDVVNKLRNILKIRKIGHAGTLDPFATGLLIIGVGQGTKSLSDFQSLSKHYDALIRFGIETNTYDKTGEIINSKSAENLTLAQIENVVTEMRGEIEQIPPMFSAKKVSGKRLYKLARKNIEIERQPARVNIYKANIVTWDKPFLQIALEVSTGTYIRSYAYDIGKMVKCGAHLEALERTAIGEYKVENSFTIPEFIKYWAEN